jgi:hypothetical protein
MEEKKMVMEEKQVIETIKVLNEASIGQAIFFSNYAQKVVESKIKAAEEEITTFIIKNQ